MNKSTDLDTDADFIVVDLSPNDFIALCGNPDWRIIWLQKSIKGFAVRAERIRTEPKPAIWMPYKD